jgi:hypothetical protein
MLRIEITKRSSAFGNTRREEVNKLAEILKSLTHKLEVLGVGQPGADGSHALQDGSGEIVGRWWFDGASLHAPGAIQPPQFSESEKYHTPPHGPRVHVGRRA